METGCRNMYIEDNLNIESLRIKHQVVIEKEHMNLLYKIVTDTGSKEKQL